jgi:hypothetical protein
VFDRSLSGSRLKNTSLTVPDGGRPRLHQPEASPSRIERFKKTAAQFFLAQASSANANDNLSRPLQQWRYAIPCFPKKLPVRLDPPMPVIFALSRFRLSITAEKPQSQPLILVIVGYVEIWRRRDDKFYPVLIRSQKFGSPSHIPFDHATLQLGRRGMKSISSACP